MNNDLLNRWIEDNAFKFDSLQVEQLVRYSKLLHSENSKYNLTGLKEYGSILYELLINSIDPLVRMNVPRGTRLLDIGTGPGIPGIPLSIAFPQVFAVLVDSNNKKISFINKVITALGLHNVRACAARSEEFLDNEGLRDVFDLVVSRAMGNVYMCVELAAGYLAPGGHLYLYSRENPEKLNKRILEHAGQLGLQLLSRQECKNLLIAENSLIFKKNNVTPLNFPRRFSVIRREARRFE